MLGVVMDLNFHRVGGEAIYLYYPVILLAATVAFMINPLPIFTLQSRKRLLVSLVGMNVYVVEIATDTVPVASSLRRPLSRNMV
jgi:hypothetical protein